tara:strand:- start:93 stop:332 length:240 start_codon:yes stop_codon:yes gene_type:complete
MTKKNQEIDLRGLKCPIVVLKIAKEIKQAKVGKVFKFLVNDPKAENDIEELAKNINIKILEKEKFQKQSNYCVFVLEKN